MGPQGPQGVPGISQVAGFSGPAFSLPSEMVDFAFIGQTTTIFVGTWATVSGMAQAAVGASAADSHLGSADFYYDLCFGWGSTAIPFSAWPAQGSLNNRPVSWTAMASTQLSPGVYEIGFCAKNTGFLTADQVYSTSGWVQITDGGP